MKTIIKILLLVVTSGYSMATAAQASSKTITRNTYSWVSINSNLFVSKKYFIMADVHVRENNFFASNSFVFGRLGLGYQINNNLSVAAGYGNLSATPTTAGWTTRADESRLFEQVQVSSVFKKLKTVQKIRAEQRWQQVIVNDAKTGAQKFTNRLRYAVSFMYPVFKKEHLPQLVLADECMLQFGKSVVYNTFDQNRVFIGINQKITTHLSFDAGYMRIFQQKNNGSSYNKSDVCRLFFYYNLPYKKG